MFRHIYREVCSFSVINVVSVTDISTRRNHYSVSMRRGLTRGQWPPCVVYLLSTRCYINTKRFQSTFYSLIRSISDKQHERRNFKLYLFFLICVPSSLRRNVVWRRGGGNSILLIIYTTLCQSFDIFYGDGDDNVYHNPFVKMPHICRT